MINVKRYSSSYENDWNIFLKNSANGTFLLNRRFMEYHKKRHHDYSLLLYDKNNIVAIVPASEKGHIIYSHEGLTYGGLIVKPQTPLLTTLGCFYALNKYYFKHGYTKIIYKPVPSFCIPRNMPRITMLCFYSKPNSSP